MWAQRLDWSLKKGIQYRIAHVQNCNTAPITEPSEMWAWLMVEEEHVPRGPPSTFSDYPSPVFNLHVGDHVQNH